jgi:MoxR-like ATPase
MPKTNEPGAFTPIVEIKNIEDFREDGNPIIFGDRRDGRLYKYTDGTKLAINIALATGRPLLILGATGCGKSSMAFNLARVMHRRYYEFVVTSRSQARDLFYRYDAVRRLGDSQLGRNGNTGLVGTSLTGDLGWQNHFSYIEPSPLWWIFDKTGARNRGYLDTDNSEQIPRVAKDPVIWPEEPCDASSILLIDEIDKADPDFPNNLLVPFGSKQFTVEEIATTITIDSSGKTDDPLQQPLIIITSNQQRELPDTFLRRCIVLEISSPTPEELVELAVTTFGIRNDDFYKNIASGLEKIHGKELSAAEFLDAVQAIKKLKASGSAQSEIIERSSWRSIEPY